MSRSLRRWLQKVMCAFFAAFFLLGCACLYVCRTEDGYISFFCDGVLVEQTAIPVELLPEMDAQAVEFGIISSTLAGCTKISEDFCS